MQFLHLIEYTTPMMNISQLKFIIILILTFDF